MTTYRPSWQAAMPPPNARRPDRSHEGTSAPPAATVPLVAAVILLALVVVMALAALATTPTTIGVPTALLLVAALAAGAVGLRAHVERTRDLEQLRGMRRWKDGLPEAR
jgi:hypothetical protein